MACSVGGCLLVCLTFAMFLPHSKMPFSALMFEAIALGLCNGVVYLFAIMLAMRGSRDAR
jgi:hypothetical protein